MSSEKQNKVNDMYLSKHYNKHLRVELVDKMKEALKIKKSDVLF